MPILLLELPREFLECVLETVPEAVDWRSALLSCRALCSLASAKDKKRRYDSILYIGMRRFNPKRLPSGVTTMIVGRSGCGKTNALHALIAALECTHWAVLSNREQILAWSQEHANVCAAPQHCRCICAVDDFVCPTGQWTPLRGELRKAEHTFEYRLGTVQGHFYLKEALHEAEQHMPPCVYILEPRTRYIRDLHQRGYITDETRRQLGLVRTRRNWLVFDANAAVAVRIWTDVPLRSFEMQRQ